MDGKRDKQTDSDPQAPIAQRVRLARRNFRHRTRCGPTGSNLHFLILIHY